MSVVMSASCVLFHGPGARTACLAHVRQVNGRLVAPPFGDDGLKVAEAREATELLFSPPVGEKIGVVVLGPMDRATPDAVDALLKTIEEFPSGVTLPVLWAHELEDVWGVLRSRCLEHWCSAPATVEEDGATTSLAWDLLEGVLTGDLSVLIRLIEKQTKGEKVDALIQAIIVTLASDLQHPARRKMWDSLRVLTRQKQPTRVGLVSALLDGMVG